MLKVYTAPDVVPDLLDEPVDVFLAGSIEQDRATYWQTLVLQQIAELPVTAYNPRREEWDSSWGDDHPELTAQINWELDHLHAARVKFFFFQPGTMSPISLMELGLSLGTSGAAPNWPIIIVCPPGFWRRRNVLVTAEAYGVKVYDTLSEGIEVLKSELQRLHYALSH